MAPPTTVEQTQAAAEPAPASFDPARPDFKPYGFSCVRWRPSPMRRPDHHNEVELNYLPSGWLTYQIGSRRVRLEAGKLGVFWAAIPHQIVQYDPEIEYFVATIPFTWFLQFKMPDALVQGLLRGEVYADQAHCPFHIDVELFANWEADLRTPSRETREIVLLEMEARLMRLASSVPGVHDGTPCRRSFPAEAGGLNKIEQMACLIARRYSEPLTVEDIGREVGLHPNYAMNLFKKTFGTTLIECLTSHRLSHAQRMLSTTNAKIIEVAFSSGFNSISRFNQAFRQNCGCTPREYRTANLRSA